MEIQYRRNIVDLLKYFNLPLIAAEIGVAEGNYSKDLLESGIEKLYSVDAWKQLQQTGDGGYDQEWHDKNYKSTVEKLKSFGYKSEIIRGISYLISDGIEDLTLGLVYIDCDHSYIAVSRDIASWYPKLVHGGIMAFHDYENTGYGVKQAVNDFAIENNLEVHLIPEDKPEDAGAWIQKQ
jgi:hypothetical protein